MHMNRFVFVLMFALAFSAACAKKKPVTAATQPPPPTASATQPTNPPPPPRAAERVEDAVPVPAISEDAIGNRSLEDLNRDSPFKPAFFGLDSAELDDAGRAIVAGN